MNDEVNPADLVRPSTVIDTKVAELPAKWRAEARIYDARASEKGSTTPAGQWFLGCANQARINADELGDAIARQEADKKAASVGQQGAGNVVIEGLRLADQFFDGQDEYWQWDDGECFPGSKVREALQAALSPAAQAVDQWQPIETAPRDRTPFIAWFGDYAESGYFVDDGIFVWQHDGDSPIKSPTHWMPLPALPIDQQAGKGVRHG